MRQITICSRAHAPELASFYGGMNRHVLRRGANDGEFFLVVREDGLNAGLLMDMMQNIVLESNPIVSGKSRLSAALKGMIGENVRKAMLDELEQYASAHERLNIDGYIRFRLASFENRISGILYSVVKRNLYIEYF